MNITRLRIPTGRRRPAGYWSERDLNPGPADFKSSALTTRPLEWLTIGMCGFEWNKLTKFWKDFMSFFLPGTPLYKARTASATMDKIKWTFSSQKWAIERLCRQQQFRTHESAYRCPDRIFCYLMYPSDSATSIFGHENWFTKHVM